MASLAPFFSLLFYPVSAAAPHLPAAPPSDSSPYSAPLPEYAGCQPPAAPPPSYAKVIAAPGSDASPDYAVVTALPPTCTPPTPPLRHSATRFAASVGSAFHPVLPHYATVPRPLNKNSRPSSPVNTPSSQPPAAKPCAWSTCTVSPLPPSPPVMISSPPGKATGPRPVLPVCVSSPVPPLPPSPTAPNGPLDSVTCPVSPPPTSGPAAPPPPPPSLAPRSHCGSQASPPPSTPIASTPSSKPSVLPSPSAAAPAPAPAETPLNSVLGDSSASEPGSQAASQPAETPAQQGKASVVAADDSSLERWRASGRHCLEGRGGWCLQADGLPSPCHAVCSLNKWPTSEVVFCWIGCVRRIHMRNSHSDWCLPQDHGAGGVRYLVAPTTQIFPISLGRRYLHVCLHSEYVISLVSL